MKKWDVSLFFCFLSGGLFCYNAVVKKLLVLLNPSSGRGKSLRQKSRIETCFNNHGLDHDLMVTGSEDHLRHLSAEVSGKYETVIGVGGDTTFTIMAGQILENPAPTAPKLGFIGTGSANDVCRSLGLNDVERLCVAIEKDSVRRMDVGILRVNGKPDGKIFLGSVSVGLGTLVNQAVEQFGDRHRLLSRNRLTGQLLAGALGVIRAFRENQVPREMTLSTAGDRYAIRFSLLAFLNINHYANGLQLNPGGSPFDGRIECLVIHTRSFFGSLSMIRKIRTAGDRPGEGIEKTSGPRFGLQSDDPFDIQVDGEILTNLNRCDIFVQPGALRVYAPV